MQPHRVSRPSSFARSGLLAALCASAALLASPARAGEAVDFAGVSLKVLSSRAPPGGAVQLVLTMTEPKPILTGTSLLSFGSGLKLMGASLLARGAAVSDFSGTAVVRGGGQVVVRTTSPSALLGTAPGVPILTLTLGVSPDAVRGTNGTLALDPAASLWLDPAGQPYPLQVKDGKFEIAGTVSITDVFPGGDVLPAGSTVVVRGVGFQPGAIVEIDGVPVAGTRFVSARELHVTVAAPADLNARNVRVKNPDLTSAKYYAYLRGIWLAPPTRPLLAATDAIYPAQTVTSAWFPNTAAAGQFLAVSVQNPSAGPAEVTVELRSSTAALLATAAVTLPPWNRIWRDAAELFGPAVPADGFLVVRSAVPVQVLGVVGDDAAASVAPQTPALAFP